MTRAREAFERARLQKAGRGMSSWSGDRAAGRLSPLGLAAAGLALVGLAAAASLLPEPPHFLKATRHVVTAVDSAAPLEQPLRSDSSIQPPASPVPPVSSASSGGVAVPRSSTTKVSKRPSVNQYAAELALLEPGRHALGQGNYLGALEAVAHHEQAFPNGQLAEERSALRVRALWVAGRRLEAERAAERFRRSYPRSGLLAWMPERAP